MIDKQFIHKIEYHQPTYPITTCNPLYRNPAYCNILRGVLRELRKVKQEGRALNRCAFTHSALHLSALPGACAKQKAGFMTMLRLVVSEWRLRVFGVRAKVKCRELGRIRRGTGRWLYGSTAWPIHTPRFVVRNQAFKNLFRRQTLMPEDNHGDLTDTQRVAGIVVYVSATDREFHGIRVVSRRETQAVVWAADE
ncbi:MAG TPA: hypothetical protein VFV58_21865 [Blastocatellia bacterium]|jgi:hypothetical protein|nr:hypothetical protein [Blastocatellia bacterium]